MRPRKEIGEMVMHPELGNWVVLEVEDGISTLIKASKLYSQEKILSDFWRVTDRYFNENFVSL